MKKTVTDNKDELFLIYYRRRITKKTEKILNYSLTFVIPSAQLFVRQLTNSLCVAAELTPEAAISKVNVTKDFFFSLLTS